MIKSKWGRFKKEKSDWIIKTFDLDNRKKFPKQIPKIVRFLFEVI